VFMRMIYDDKLAQAAYLIGCQNSGEAIVIDPERDVDRYTDLAERYGLSIVACAETHIHADFVSGSRELAERLGATVYVSDEGDADWKYGWLGSRLAGGSYDHRLLRHGNTFAIGAIEFAVLHTPGHTPEHICLLVTDRGSGATEPVGILTGDFLFVGDLGRPDLLETAAGVRGAMGPSAHRLYASLERLREVPEFVQVWPAHGAGSACGKDLGAVPFSTIGYERRFNAALRKAEGGERAFVDFILSGQTEPPVYFANMKRDNKIGPRVLGTLPAPERMNAREVARLDAHDTVVIDTRGWDRFRNAHAPGALSIPIDRMFNTNAGSFVRDTDEIVLVVDPDRLEECVRDLVRVGLDRVKGWCANADFDALDPEPNGLVGSRSMTPAELAPSLGSGAVTVLDVRRATEFDEGHIPGAVNIAHTRLMARIEEIPSGGPIVVHCRSGVRSSVSVSYLERLGYDARDLSGGFLAWDESQSTAANLSGGSR